MTQHKDKVKQRGIEMDKEKLKVTVVNYEYQKGADVHLPTDQAKNRPLAIAEELGFQETADLLRKHGA